MNKVDFEASNTSGNAALSTLLQSFGQSFNHQTGPTFQWRLRSVLYSDIVSQFSYDPFFPRADPDFTKPLHKQQGSTEGSEYSEAARGRPCGHVFGKGETVFRCRNCGMDDTCVMCQKCYRASNHEGHDVAMSINGGNGGCCDCGDREAWREDMQCKYHYSESPVDPIKQPPVPKEYEHCIRKTVSCILDFVLDVMSHAKDSATAPRLDDDTDPRLDAVRSRLTGTGYLRDLDETMEESYSAVLWNDEKHNFEEVIDIVKRACKKPKVYGRQIAQAVDSRGRATVYTGKIDEAIRIATFLSRIRLGVTVRCARDIFREDMVEVLINFLQDLANLCIILPDGNQNTELVRRIICEEMCGSWRQGVRMVGIGKTSEMSEAMADSEDDEEEDVDVEAEEVDVDIEMIDAQNNLPAVTTGDPQENTDLATHLAELTNEERQAMLIVHNMTRGEIGLPPQTALPVPGNAGQVIVLDQNDEEERLGMQAILEMEGRRRAFDVPPRVFFPEVVTEDGTEETTVSGNMRTPPSLSIDTNRLHVNPPHWTADYQGVQNSEKTRLTALFLQDLRLWKQARAGLRKLYITTMVAIPSFKREMGIRFAVAYKELTEAFLFADREPDQSMILFSVQIFTAPSIAAVLVKDFKFITTLLAVCYTYYSQHRIGYPDEVDTNAKQLNDVYAFRSRRHYHIVNDLRYLLCTGAVQQLVPSLKYVHAQFIDWLELFQGQNPQQKALRHHVEYESDSWVSAFNVTMQIAKHAQMYARTFIHAKREGEHDQLKDVLSLCYSRLKSWSSGDANNCRPAFEPRTPHAEYISFHHPLHWFMVGLASHLKVTDDLRFLHDDFHGMEHLFRIASYPLRVIHMIWEIKCNMWVRNGHSIRVQLYHYTDVDSREYCIDKDVQYVQMVLASLGTSCRFAPEARAWSDANGDTARYLKQFYKHGPIVDWMVNSIFKSVPEAHYMGNEINVIHMQDYLFHFFISLFSERAWLLKPTSEENIARALRHGLIFGPKTYSEITKMTNDDRGDEACFDRVVEKITIYTPPTGLEDVGRFRLKDAEFDLVDPYYIHYTLQQIEETCEILHRRRMDNNFVPEQALEPIDHGPWSGLVDFPCCGFIQEYIVTYFTSLSKAAAVHLHVATIRDSVTDKILQFLLLVLQEETARRNRGAITLNWNVFPLECADYFLQNNLLHEPYLRPHQAKLSLLLQRLRHLNGEVQDNVTKSPASPGKREFHSDETDEVEFARKKALAKARQAQLMLDMKASQDAFLKENKSAQEESKDVANTEEINESTWRFPAGNCIICQNAVGRTGETYGVLSCIQESRLDRNAPNLTHFVPGLQDLINHPVSMDEHRNWTPPGIKNFPTDQSSSKPTITTCGHVMHWTCYNEFFDAIKTLHSELVHQGRNLPDRIEFQCPLCKTVGNTMLPILSRSYVKTSDILSSDRNVLSPSSHESLYMDKSWKKEEPLPFVDLATSLVETLDANTDLSQRLDALQKAARATNSDDILLTRATTTDLAAYAHHAGYLGDLNSALVDNSDHQNAITYGTDKVWPTSTFAGHVPEMARVRILAASIVDVEIALRDRTHNDNSKSSVTTLVEGMSEQNIISLRTQAHLCRAELSIAMYTTYIQAQDATQESAGIRDFLGPLLRRRCQLLPNRDAAEMQKVAMHFSLFQEDNFSIFVELDMIGACQTQASVLASLLLEAEIVKTVIVYLSDFSSLSQDDITAVQMTTMSDSHCQTMRAWLASIMPQDLTYPDTNIHLSILYRVMQQFALAFVRKYAIYATAVLGYERLVSIDPATFPNELDKLLNTYQLRSIEDIMHFSDSQADARRQHIQRTWCAQDYKARRKIKFLQWPLPVTLAALPHSLEVLFEQCLHFICPRCNTNPNQPALCLFCGKLLCFQSQCCWNDTAGVGECTSHREQCGGSLGMYLIVKRSSLLVMRRDGGAFGPAPYLDLHGELDPDLRRGKPQFLSERRYEAGVRQLYLQHQIPTWLARKLESHTDMGGWETL